MKLNNPSKIAILMATYNGAKYLAEQINSIIGQTVTDWNLYIQDDGSSDNTLEIIKEYLEKDKRIHLVDLGLTYQGATLNFMTLLNIVESEYYMFSDQDDVWKPFKIEVSFNKMKEIEMDNKPVLVGTDKTRVNEKLEIILDSEFVHFGSTREMQLKVLKERSKLDMLRCLCPIAGCTMLFNHAAKIASRHFFNLRYQDSIVSMAVAKSGGIIDFVLESTMFYRLHSSNTCGVNEQSRSKKIYMIKNNIRGLKQMYLLYHLYGGDGIIRFLFCRWRLFRTFRSVSLYHR